MSTRARQLRSTLRWSILATVGIVPIACSGKHVGGGSEEPQASAGQGGSRPRGNKPSGSSGKSGTTGTAGTGIVTPTAGAGGATGTAGAGGAALGACTEPTLDPVSGLVSCAEGYDHRPAAVTCELSVGGAAASYVGGAGGAEGGAGQLPRVNGEVSCFHNEAACEAFELGYCEEQNGGGGNPAACYSGCVTDDDCGDGSVCLCRGPSPTGGVCVQSNCRTDADCGPGSLCASHVYGSFACQRAADECRTDADCLDFKQCWFNGSHRVCENLPTPGRPFLVEERMRLAEPCRTNEWLGAGYPPPCLEQLRPGERAALAAHWTKMALMEHASIAAFARFNLQLLSLGAPPELVEECTRAMADETAHARLCFELASVYAGHGVGPGPLDVGGSLAASSLAEIVDLVIAEGCIGETRATLEALEAAEAASDPVVRAAYTRIACDEERHAALAFRFVRWALDRDPGVAEHVARVCAAPARDDLEREVVQPALQATLAATATDSRRSFDPSRARPGTRDRGWRLPAHLARAAMRG